LAVIEVFHRKAKRKVVTQPKFFLFDVGVYKTLRPKGPLDLESEIEGPALETLVYQEIKAQIEYRRLDYKIYYWRTSQKEEVDLVLYGESGFIALEIKSTFRFRNSDLKALKLFLEDYPSAKAFFLYTGEENLTVDGIQVMNIEKFLLEAGAILAK
jgi:predicted AAA+ superfamily ATPase